jgi:DNA transformation protein
MFGGAGIYCEGVMFALIADEMLYFKSDDLTRPDFQAEGLAPFAYRTRHGTHTLTSYWRAPDRCLDDLEAMAEWASKARSAALRARKP